MSIETIRSYFVGLAEYSIRYLDRLPLEREPQPLAYAMQRLLPAIDEGRSQEVEGLRQLNRPKLDKHTRNDLEQVGVGLNTVGMLTDRLTILIMKEWCLRNKANSDPAKAQQLRDSQTRDIIESLARARPGNPSLSSKLTRIKADIVAECWEEAYFGLMTTNVMLWESQEVLYIKDIAQLPCSELRDYIKWFAQGNIVRNEYIQRCEMTYWQD